MKYKKKDDVGKLAKILFDGDVLNILRTISHKAWITEIPYMFIELINDNFDVALEAVRYVPNIYFKLNDQFKNEGQLINATIKSFRKHNKSNEIDIRIYPLTKKKRSETKVEGTIDRY